MYINKKRRINVKKIVVTMLIIGFIISATVCVFADVKEDFMRAVKNGDVSAVKGYLEKDPSLIKCKDKNENNPLHLATLFCSRIYMTSSTDDGRYLKVVECLLSNGVPVNEQNIYGQTPLHFAVLEGGNIEIARFLLDRGADIKSLNKKGDTPLHNAARGHDTGIIDFLISRDSDINARNFAGRTPLHIAAVITDKDMVSHLISKGAIVDAKGNDGNTPLHIAAFVNDADCVKVLLSKGADKNARNKKGEVPSQLANDEEIIKILKVDDKK